MESELGVGVAPTQEKFFLTGINQIPEEPMSAIPRSIEGGGQESMDSMQENKVRFTNRTINSSRKVGGTRNSMDGGRRKKGYTQTVSGFSFERMTNCLLSKADENLDVKSPNVFIGNAALRGHSLNDNRFENIEKMPGVSSEVKLAHLPQWKLISNRQIDFRLKVYNHNVYKPK